MLQPLSTLVQKSPQRTGAHSELSEPGKVYLVLDWTQQDLADHTGHRVPLGGRLQSHVTTIWMAAALVTKQVIRRSWWGLLEGD